jgi:hypothetical protein
VSTTVSVTIDELYDVYFWGASEGQLLMEEERENEELFDAAVCSAGSRKLCVPTSPVRRRQVHSEQWFKAMREGKKNFKDFLERKLRERA